MFLLLFEYINKNIAIEKLPILLVKSCILYAGFAYKKGIFLRRYLSIIN